EQRAGVAFGKNPGRDLSLDRRRQAQETQLVGDGPLAPSKAPPQLLLGPAEPVQETPVACGFLQRRQVLPLEVLDHGQGGRRLVAELPYNGGDSAPTQLPAGAPPALTHPQLIAA